MSQLPPNPEQPQSDVPPTEPPAQSPTPTPPPPPMRRRRRWPWVVGALVLVLVLLVVLLPTIASTAPVRAFVVNRINANIDGRMEIQDWSLGWTSGIRMQGVKLYDEQNAEVLDAPRIVTGLTLLEAIRGKFDLGQTQIDVANFVLVIDERGTNFQRVLRIEPADPDEPIELPDVRGQITLNYRGTVVAPDAPTVHVEPSTAVLDIPDINGPIGNRIELAYRTGHEPAVSQVLTSGTLTIAESNIVNLQRLSGEQRLALEAVDLGALGALIPDLQLGGSANGQIDLRAEGLAGISAAGQIDVDNLLVAGPALAGDEFRTSQLLIPMQITRTEVDPQTTLIRIERFGLEMPEATVAISGQVPEAALENLLANRPPGAAGSLRMTIDAPQLAAIANQFRNTLRVDPRVEFEAGTFSQVTTLEIQPERVHFTQTADIAARGRRAGEPIVLRPIHAETSLTAIPTGQPMPQLRDLNLLLQSPFAEVRGGGETVANLQINGTFDLEQMQREVGQFLDLPPQLTGNGRFALVTRGDPTRTDEPVAADLKVDLFPAGQAQPLVNLDAGATVRLDDQTLPSFALRTLTVTDLNLFQQQFGALVPALAEHSIRLQAGQLYANVAGSFDGTTLRLTKPLAVSIPGLTLSVEDRPVLTREIVRAHVLGSFTIADPGFGGHLTDVSVTTQSNMLTVTKVSEQPLTFEIAPDGAIRGNGALNVQSNLPQLNRVAQAFAGVAPAPDQPQLRAGVFSGTITLAKADRPQTDIDLSAQISGLTVAVNGADAIANEQVRIGLQGVVPDDITMQNPVVVNGNVTSAFVESTIRDVQLLPQADGALAKVRNADVQATLPDLPRMWALVSALAPAAAPAAPGMAAPGVALLPPLQITRGDAALALRVQRDGAVSRIEVPEARINGLELRRAERAYPFEEPIVIRLAAEAAEDAQQRIDTLTVTQLSGDLSVATLSMPANIVISDLLTAAPILRGGVRVEGEIEPLTELMAVIQYADPLPYAGAYVIAQTVSAREDRMSLEGEMTAQNFRVFDVDDPQQTLFSEEKLTVTNAVNLDQTKRVAHIRALNVDMASSQALRVKVADGVLERWGTEADGRPVLVSFQRFAATIDYDLEKIWPIIRPLLATPEEPLDEVEVAGQYISEFQVNGPLYAGELHEALREIQVVGALSVGRFSYPGIEVENLEVPVYLRRGVLQTEYAGRPAAERMPAPAAFNGGTLSIGGISVDLTQPDPRLSVPGDYRLLANASINPLLGDRLGRFVNPLFSNAQRARGLLDITIESMDNVALGPAIKTADSGSARIRFSIRDLDIANPLGSLMLGPLIGALNIRALSPEQADVFQGSIREGLVTLEAGRTKQDITVELIDPRTVRAPDVVGTTEPVQPKVMPMRFQGDVSLNDLRQSIAVTLPVELVTRFIPDDGLQRTLTRAFPQGIPLTLRGTTLNPEPDAEGFVRRMIEAQIPGLIGADGPGVPGALEDLLRRRDRDRERDRNQNR